MQLTGKFLIIIGVIIIISGLIMTFYGKIPFLGKLPGDISIKGKNYSVYIPIATSLLISLLISLILYLYNKLFK